MRSTTERRRRQASTHALVGQFVHRLEALPTPWGTGGRFQVALSDELLPEHALLVAEKIRAALARPFDLACHQVQVFPSIGVALYPDHGSDYKQLIRHADEAMYEAKKDGGNRYRITTRPRVQP